MERLGAETALERPRRRDMTEEVRSGANQLLLELRSAFGIRRGFDKKKRADVLTDLMVDVRTIKCGPRRFPQEAHPLFLRQSQLRRQYGRLRFEGELFGETFVGLSESAMFVQHPVGKRVHLRGSRFLLCELRRVDLGFTEGLQNAHDVGVRQCDTGLRFLE